MALRYYQEEAVEAVYKFCGENTDKNPCVVLPTGAGKTHVIAQICRDVAGWGGRAIVVAHVKELIDQAAKKLMDVGGIDIGIYSAGLNRRDTDSNVIVAGIQSVYQRGLELSGSRPFNMVIVDEAHRIPTEGEGMYQRLLNDLKAANPKIRVVGLTATPYRTGEGYVCSDAHFLNKVCYQADIKELIAGGFLCPLSSKRSVNEIDMSGVKISRGDFVESQMEERFNEENKVAAAVEEIVKYTKERSKVLIFCCGIGHASAVSFSLENLVPGSVRVVTSEHSGRDGAIEAFKRGGCKYLVNVNCLTEGFDATAIDCVVLLRATVSPGLYYQMVGRGLRVDPLKQDCLVLDFGGNVERHGTIDNLRIRPTKAGEGDGEAPAKPCPECNEIIHAGLLACPACGHEFPPPPPNHEATASGSSPLGEAEDIEYEVNDVSYFVHQKKNAPDAPLTMRVSYWDGTSHIADEWVCIEHSGFAWEKAFAWWHRRSANPMPKTAEDAVGLAVAGALIAPTKIKVRKPPGERFSRIVGYELPERPTEPIDKPIFDNEEVPF